MNCGKPKPDQAGARITPKGVDLEPLVSLYAIFVHGLPVRARDGATRETMVAATAAMAAWDGLIGTAQARRKAK